MAEPITIAQLIDASEDAQTLALFSNADAATQVPRRLADPIETLDYWRNYMSALATGKDGASGVDGVDGVSATIDSLTVATGEAGTQASVVTGGTPLARTFALTVPRGDKGLDGSFTQKSYTTYALMDADKVNIPSNTSVTVTNDTDSTKNGMYAYNGTAFTKSTYDPVTLAASDATTKANNAKTQAVADSKTYTDAELVKAANKSSGTFDTLALLTASVLADNSYALVANDTDSTKNGHYKKVSGVWTKVAYNPVKTSELTFAINSITTIDPAANIYLKANDTTGFYIDFTLYKYVASTSSRIHTLAVKEGESYIFNTSKDLKISYSDGLPVNGKAVTKAVVDTTAFNTHRVLIPKGVTHLVFNTFISTINVVDTLVVNKHKAGVVGYKEYEFADATARKTLGDAIVSQDLVPDVIAEKNILRSKNVITSSYITGGGAIVASAGKEIWSAPVVAGETYAIYASVFTAGFMLVGAAEYNYPQSTSVTLINWVDTADGNVKTVTIPAGMNYLFITVVFDAKFDVRGNIWINKGTTSTKFIRTALSSIDGYPLNDALAQERLDNLGTALTAGSPLKDKKWAAVGDSITAVTSHASSPYPTLVAAKAGAMSMYNYGDSGSGFFRNIDISTRITQTNLDYITVLLGVNDSGGTLPMGNFLDVVDTTVNGCLNLMLQGLRTNHPLAKLILLTPIPKTGNQGLNAALNANGYNLKDIADLVIKYAAHYSLPCFDLYRNSNIYPDIAAHRDTYLIDGLHPNNAGHVLIAHKIFKFMETV